MTPLERVSRRLRFGSPIIVVSGLPRSGTSLMMQMLGAGGLPLMTDGLHAADESNPEGYFELDAVKDLATGFDLSWLDVTRGKAVKVHSPLLVCLPERYNYRVILMQRPLREVIASQHLAHARAGESMCGTTTDAGALVAQYQSHLRKIHTLLAARPCFASLIVDYHEVLADPRVQARRVRRFVLRPLALPAMAGVVNERLYRSRITEPEAKPEAESEPEPAGSRR
jgi:hypothetical protein